MRGIQFRTWLPIALGLVSIALMAQRLLIPAWSFGVFNENQINWHCEGPDFTLVLLNAPSTVAAWPSGGNFNPL
jgi:hypothetical protein